MILTRGICLSTHQYPKISDLKIIDGPGTGSFTSVISGLRAETIYFIRAYVTNNVGTGYGNQYSVTTPAEVQSITTTIVSDITSSTAVSGGNLTGDAGTVPIMRGVCWCTTAGPTIVNSVTQAGPGTGSFISSLTGLQPGTTYYVRAYATSSTGTIYGNEQSFKAV